VGEERYAGTEVQEYTAMPKYRGTEAKAKAGRVSGSDVSTIMTTEMSCLLYDSYCAYCAVVLARSIIERLQLLKPCLFAYR